MERVVNPGPIDRTLLLSQHEHKSKLLWKGELSFSSLMRTVRMNDAWNLFCLHRPHGHVDEILRRSGLYDVVCVGRMQYDRALVTTMVLFGLRIDGDAVYMHDDARRIRPWRTLLETLTGCAIAPAEMDGASRVRIHNITGYLRNQLQVDPIGDATLVERVEKISRLYMLVILGGILFPNTSGNLISLQYLAFLDPIHDVGKYSWGSAVLAYLYRALCRASIGNVVDICGFIPLLQIHTTGPSSTVEESPTTIIEGVVPTVNEDPVVTQIHTTGPSSTVDSSPTTIIEDIVPTVKEDPDVTQTTLSPLSSPDVTFIMPVDDMPQTPGRKKVVKRIVKNVNIKDHPAKKRKRDNEDEDGYTGLRPRDVLRISRKGCGT
ncbi:hypothetical protein KY290_034124 [Solanum tuberosum]|uniref:Aminotransferase-like plant mobile domain-containing protein n=1 Tax=Solanum tuberosum TaxID=4113 RepID=A0ABQ7U2Q4_SOLTU|nr:hypothetical protein KY289_033518 [Solanum tuberosum]KAH0741081.1 hypothetical protein KY290_034124 [Solanum tuberosum]